MVIGVMMFGILEIPFLMTYALQSGVYPIKLLTFHPLALQSKMKLSICMLTDCRKGN
ncbi:hypothetical protein TheetDRAFT_2959 [Thermoanaerobacter ethanolicus JW 200]|nr:hypothetical protein TheetDRAFT_2959 [Thermoanaerobacter ethanolicus JW 200]